MGVLVNKQNNTYPAYRRVEKAARPQKDSNNYMNELTKSFLSNFRAFFEAAEQSR